jgi:predicted transcriptional regulator
MRRGMNDNELDVRLRPSSSPSLGPLFDPTEPRARTSDPVTSHAAAASMLEAADVQRAILVNLLRAHGPMTADELDALAGWRVTTSGRRLGELERLGRVERTEATRPTSSGRAALVWRAR